jgi:hypothetical protein
MKITNLICISAIMALGFVFCGCKRALPPGAVLFSGADVTLTPGDDWKPKKPDDSKASQQGTCSPVLKGQGQSKGSMIQVYCTDKQAEPESAVAVLRVKLAAAPDTLQDTIKQEDFTTDSGLRGIHFSFEFTVPVEGQMMRLRSHSYLFENKKGRCVGINYVSYADRDLEAVHQMILKTLVLQ